MHLLAIITLFSPIKSVKTHGRASLLLRLLTNIRKHYFTNVRIIIV